MESRSSPPKAQTQPSLGWRTWATVVVTSFAFMSQTFTTIAAGSVLAFIVRDLGDASLGGWIVQAPLLMQAALAPPLGRLSDVLDRKYLAAIPFVVAFAGAVVCATAPTLPGLVGGSVLIGFGLSTVSVVQAIPAEVLPLKWRVWANGATYIGGAVGGLTGVLGAGALATANPAGWRAIFWIQAAFHLVSAIGLLVFYNPPRRERTMSWGQILWMCDPVGSLLFVSGATLLLLAFDWASGLYAWSDPHVAVPLALGWVLLAGFAGYEWKGRSDGLMAHVFFRDGPNFALACGALIVEGWIFYSAVNTLVPQIILNLGFASTPLSIAIRQLASTVPALLLCFPIAYYSTRRADLKTPLLAGYTIFLAATICFCTLTPAQSSAQLGYSVLVGVGQSAPLLLLVAVVQYSSPHAFLSTASGLAFSARAIGGAFGSAALNAVVSARLAATYPHQVGQAALAAGLPQASVQEVVVAMLTGGPLTLQGVKGVTPDVAAAVVAASEWAYARAYNVAWASIVPFVVLALAAVACLRGVEGRMTETVEATVEVVARNKERGDSTSTEGSEIA